MKFLDRSTFYLRLIFVVATALIFFLMALTYKHLERSNDNNDQVYQSFETSLQLKKLFSELKNLETERRNFILSKSNDFRDISKLQNKIKKDVIDLKKLLDDNPKQLADFKTLDTLINYKLNIVDNTVAEEKARSQSLEDLKTALTRGNDVMKQITFKIDEMIDNEKNLLEERKSAALFTQKNTPIYLYIISLFSLGLVAFAFYKISKDVRKQKEINRELEISLNTLNLAETVGGYGMWIYDFKNQKYTFSDNEYRILGHEPKSFPATYENFIKHIHPEDLDFVNKKAEEMLNGGNMLPFRYRVIRKDGKLRHFQTIGKKVETIGGDNIILGITLDVSNEIESQLKLESANWILTERNKRLSISNETFEEAEKIGKFGTWQWFIKENRFNFSDNIVRLFGLNPANFNHQLSEFLPAVHPEDLPMVEEKMKSMYAQEFIQPFVHRIIRADDGALRYISVSSKIINDPVIGDYFLVITQDITEEYLDKKVIAEKNVILEANNEELQAFNYVASHDLQEPLRKIETFISRLRDKEYEGLSDSGKQYLDRINFSAGRMRNLINDLLQFSRTVRTEQTFEKTNLNEIMKSALEELQEKITEKQAVINSDKLPTLKVVPFQIQQLFINIIGNSLKYSKDEVPPLVNIKVEKVSSENEPTLNKKGQKDYFKISFEDNGIGFEQEYAGKIFTLFNRLHDKSAYEGTGIGLAICKKIMDNHNGVIQAHGSPGEGSVFTLYFPEK